MPVTQMLPCGILAGFIAALIAAPSEAAPSELQDLQNYDVSWTSPGSGPADSMPLGNGDIGLNVWTEQNGDILLYISKSDAWAEDGNLVKLGCVRLSLTPCPFTTGAPFRQTLRLQDGAIELAAGDGGSAAQIRIWVDANHPVVNVEASSNAPVSIKVTREPWRATAVGKVSADVLGPAAGNAISWYHRNEAATSRPLAGITFGALMGGEGLIRTGETSLETEKPATSSRIWITALTAAAADAASWQEKLSEQATHESSRDIRECWSAHRAWWREFWNRSWIFVSGDEAAEQVTRGATLQRFITACAGRGAYPIKFNGSIFTVGNPSEPKGRDKATGQPMVEPVGADFRAWGGQYWFQNTRPMYWPRLAAGDFDLMRPLFSMYASKLPESLALVRAAYGHGGAYFAETSPFWAQLPAIKPEDKGGYTLRYFTPILELTAMMLDYLAYTGDEEFARSTLLPVAKAGLTFYSEHFPRDPEGRLLIDKANAIEMFWDVTNPLPDVAGLHYVIGRLLELPPGLVDETTRAKWKTLQSSLPEIPTGVVDGKPVLLPYGGEQTAAPHNSENPELYAIYPFRIYGIGKPGLDRALNTYAARRHKRTGCWHQDVVDAPSLGLAEDARRDVTKNFTSFDPRLRFPAFWARGHDYMPDQDNGGNGELGLQKMLMQCDGRRILLLPAWPSGWSARFKLHAPFQTTVEGRVEEGRLTVLKILPESRRGDVEILSR